MSEVTRMAPPYCMVEKQEIINTCIDRFLPSEATYPQVLHEAIRYSVTAGGKRLRPILALCAFEACGGRGDRIFPAAVALEFVHTYSLIHDDLPCMDDDDLRRGLPTCHKKYGEAVALLAGDALHDLAFSLMARTGSTRAVLELAEAIGTQGMLAGQMADMEAEGKDLTLDEITYVHTRKTGMLMRGSVRIGAVLAEAEERLLERITTYGEKIGLAFQIIDDILDVEGDVAELGKPIGSDSKNCKATYPSILGLENSRALASELIDEAVTVISTGVAEPQDFIDIARFIGSRRH